jgi:hypothetical protein
LMAVRRRTVRYEVMRHSHNWVISCRLQKTDEFAVLQLESLRLQRAVP